MTLLLYYGIRLSRRRRLQKHTSQTKLLIHLHYDEFVTNSPSTTIDFVFV